MKNRTSILQAVYKKYFTTELTEATKFNFKSLKFSNLYLTFVCSKTGRPYLEPRDFSSAQGSTTAGQTNLRLVL